MIDSTYLCSHSLPTHSTPMHDMLPQPCTTITHSVQPSPPPPYHWQCVLARGCLLPQQLCICELVITQRLYHYNQLICKYGNQFSWHCYYTGNYYDNCKFWQTVWSKKIILVNLQQPYCRLLAVLSQAVVVWCLSVLGLQQPCCVSV